MQNRVILIIDDDETMLDSCEMVLKKEGYAVLTAGDGAGGLSLFQSENPDLVLLDLKMPGKSGMDVLQELKTLDPDCVVVIITGFGTIQSAVDAMKFGAYDFLPKPFTPDELRFRVQRGMERHTYIQETASLRNEKEKMRRNFISMVSHELRSPLAVVQQNLMVLSGGLAGQLPESAQQIILRMQTRLQDMLSMINDWLDLAKIESGEMMHGKESVDLPAVISGVIDMLRPLAEQKEVSMAFEADGGECSIQGSRSLLAMLFTNLVHNGIKYNRRNGKIRLGMTRENGMAKITVEDTGIGIPADKLSLIFEQFYRVRESSAETGSGLGLSIVKSIIESHGGRIEVVSEPEKSTCFTVYLPVQETAEKATG